MPDEDDVPVKLKGVGDSLWVTFNAELPVDELKKALDAAFERLQQLAVNARVILDPGKPGIEANAGLVEELGKYLKTRFNVGNVTGPPEKPQTDSDRQPTKDLDNAWHARRSDALIIAGRVRSGQKIQAQNHLIIMGDLNPGAEAIAGGDIIVLGTLLGIAIAGQPDNENAIIMAIDFRPTQIQIGGLAAAGDRESGSGGKTVEFAKIDGNKITIMDYIKNNPFKRIARPEVR